MRQVRGDGDFKVETEIFPVVLHQAVLVFRRQSFECRLGFLYSLISALFLVPRKPSHLFDSSLDFRVLGTDIWERVQKAISSQTAIRRMDNCFQVIKSLTKLCS